MTDTPRHPDRAYEARLVSVLTVTFGLAFFDRNAINQLMPYLVPALKLSNTQVGLLSSALSISWAVSGYLVGSLSDRTARHKAILLLSVLVFSLCSFLSGQAGTYGALLLARMLMGVSEGPLLPVSQSLVAMEVEPARRGVTMGVLQTFGANLLGNFAAPLVIVAMASAFGWRMAFNLAGVPGLVMVVIMALVLRAPSRAAPAPATDTAAANNSGSFRQLIGNRNILICLCISVMMVAWMTIVWTFLPLYYVQVAGVSPRTMSILMALFGISGMAVGFVVPKLSDRLGRRRLVFGATVLGGCIPLGALLTHSPVALGACALLGWTASGGFSLFMATVPTESVSRHLTTRAMALVMGAGEVLGGFSGPALAGLAADATDLRAPLYILLVLSSLASAAALLLTETAPSQTAPVRRRQDAAPGFPAG